MKLIFVSKGWKYGDVEFGGHFPIPQIGSSVMLPGRIHTTLVTDIEYDYVKQEIYIYVEN